MRAAAVLIAALLVGCANVAPRASYEQLECLATVLELPTESDLAVLGGCDEEVAP